MIKGSLMLGPISYHSAPSDVPYFPNQFLGWDCFAVSYSKTALALLTFFIFWEEKETMSTKNKTENTFSLKRFDYNLMTT